MEAYLPLQFAQELIVQSSNGSIGKNTVSLDMDEKRRLKSRIKELEEEVESKKAELQILYEMDQIRDSFPEPRSMFNKMTDLLTKKFNARFCCLYIMDDESGDLELWGSHAIGSELSTVSQRIKSERLYTWLEEKFENLTRTKEQAIIMIIKHHVPPIDLKLTEPLHIMGIQIILDNKKMGALLLGRDKQFTQIEIETMKAAESQLDSSIVQARSVRYTLRWYLHLL
jgi:GAF domain-containing protein